MQKEKVALFDFCETLVNFQTADAFVNYVREVKQLNIMHRKEKLQKLLRSIRLIQIVERLTGWRYSINKRIKLWQLKGLQCQELESLAFQYYQVKVKQNLIQELNKKLKMLKDDGYAIYLVSGGYDIYLKFFVEEFKLDGMISSRIKMKNGYCTGEMNGLDCLRNNKVYLLDKFFKEKPKYSIAFSDSITDIPLLQWANRGYVVSHKKHQLWSNEYNLEEIIWD